MLYELSIKLNQFPLKSGKGIVKNVEEQEMSLPLCVFKVKTVDLRQRFGGSDG